MARGLEFPRLMRPEPHELRSYELLTGSRASQIHELRFGHAAAEAFELVQRPRIVLLNAATDRPALVIEQNDCGKHPRNADAGECLSPRPSPVHELSNDQPG